MKNKLNLFWEDAAEKNLYYSQYVLPSAIIIHLIALFSIDIYIVGQDILISVILRGVPIIYLGVLYLMIKQKKLLVKSNYMILFLIAGVVSIIPVVYHASQDLQNNGMLFSGGMGVFIVKVMMIMFVFLPRNHTYILYAIIDLLTIASYYYLSTEAFISHLDTFAVFLILSNIILIISYHLTLDLRVGYYKNKIKIEKLNERLENEAKFKEKYFSFLAHDIKSPVNLMQSVVHLLQNGDLDNDRRNHYIDRIEFQLSSLNNLVINILDWIKTNNSEIELEIAELNLYDIIENSIDINIRLSNDKNIKIINHIDKSTVIDFDKNSLLIIINNLLRNAIKFSDIGGEISLELSTEYKIINANDAHNKKGKQVFKIINGGSLIDDKQIQDFNSSKIAYVKNGTIGEKGHGLGLEIVSTLCRLNNSRISIKNSENINSFEIIFN